MSQEPDNSHWDELLSNVGAQPAPEKPVEPIFKPVAPQPVAQPRRSAPPPAQAPDTNWGELAKDFGIEVKAEASPAAAKKPAAQSEPSEGSSTGSRPAIM